MRRVLVGLLIVAVALAGWSYFPRSDPDPCREDRLIDAPEILTGPELPVAGLAPVAAVDGATSVAVTPDGDTLFVTDVSGSVFRVAASGNGEPEVVLDLTGEVLSEGVEQGLLAVAVNPLGDRLVVGFIDLDGNSRIWEYPLFDGVIAVEQQREILFLEQPGIVHNGGQLFFDEDGLLWVGFGDGGEPESAQEPDSLLGTILRIDPTPDGDAPYRVPDDNPFVGDDEGRDEVWVYGVRNPWRFSVDAGTGDLWIGDVGQDCWEEVNLVPSGTSGVNLGWPGLEGNHAYEFHPPPDDHVGPLFVLRHGPPGVGPCSIVGGYVYRGRAISELRGAYVFGDSCSGAVEALVPDEDGWIHRPLGVASPSLVSFGERPDGELYTVSLTDGVQTLVPDETG